MIALDDRYDKKFFSAYMESELQKFNQYGGRLVFSKRMQRPFVLSLRFITMPVDRPQRMVDGGTSSGQQASRYGHIEGLLFDINDDSAVVALFKHNFDIDFLLVNHANQFKRMDIPLAMEKCKDAFLASVSDAGLKLHSFAKFKAQLQQFGPNTKTIMDVFKATHTCTLQS